MIIYDNPIKIAAEDVQFNLSTKIGTIDKSGLYTSVNDLASCYIYAKYNNFVDSVFVLYKRDE